MKICFIMYPWESVNPRQDSTIRLVHECAIRKHEVSITYANNLTIRDSIPQSNCRTIVNTGKVSGSMLNFHRSVVFENRMVAMKDFDVIMMRDNPPLDPVVLNFLDSVKDDTFIVNAIRGLREANNKIYTAAFYDPDKEIIPITHVSKNIEYLIKVIEDSPDDRMIMKPLDGYGGRGVIVIEKMAMANTRSLLEFYINKSKAESNYIILQEYVKGAENGDVRVLMLDGKPIGALRRRPAIGDMRSNISAGGSTERYKLTKADMAICLKIGKKLVQDGIYFAGLDIIEGKLIEINVLSPGTITDINRLNNVKLQVEIIDYLERTVINRTKQLKLINPEIINDN